MLVAFLLMLSVPACTEVGEQYSDAAPAVEADTRRIMDGDPRKGRAVITAIGCGVCHSIPGIRGAHGIVGPPLDKFGRRQLIAGIVPNEPATLVRWVKDAPSLAPHTGMPRLPLSEIQAKHVAAYLYTLR